MIQKIQSELVCSPLLDRHDIDLVAGMLARWIYRGKKGDYGKQGSTDLAAQKESNVRHSRAVGDQVRG
jgi:hypothetical protein